MRTLLLAAATIIAAAEAQAQTDSTTFRGRLTNDEYEIFLVIDLYNSDVSVPGQEIYGKLPGYLGKKRNTFVWLITDCQLKDSKNATIELINEYGSEDLTAEITQTSDSTYIMKQLEGSTLKVPKNGKWQKLPKTMTLKRKLP